MFLCRGQTLRDRLPCRPFDCLIASLCSPQIARYFVVCTSPVPISYKSGAHGRSENGVTACLARNDSTWKRETWCKNEGAKRIIQYLLMKMYKYFVFGWSWPLSTLHAIFCWIVALNSPRGNINYSDWLHSENISWCYSYGFRDSNGKIVTCISMKHSLISKLIFCNNMWHTLSRNVLHASLECICFHSEGQKFDHSVSQSKIHNCKNRGLRSRFAAPFQGKPFLFDVCHSRLRNLFRCWWRIVNCHPKQLLVTCGCHCFPEGEQCTRGYPLPTDHLRCLSRTELQIEFVEVAEFR